MREVEIFDSETIRELIKVTIGVTVWVPYMIMSKRVEQTFVR